MSAQNSAKEDGFPFFPRAFFYFFFPFSPPLSKWVGLVDDALSEILMTGGCLLAGWAVAFFEVPTELPF